MNYPKRLIQKGEKDKAIVKAIQKRLIELGITFSGIDGDFGDKTVKAVKLFQSQNTDTKGNVLIADGKIGAITWSVLFGEESVPIHTTTTINLLKTAMQIAETQVGVREIPKNSNAGPDVEKYLASVGLGKGNPWCMAFMFWCFNEASKQINKPNPLVKTGGCLKQWNNTTCKKISTIEAVNNNGLVKPGYVFIINHGKNLGHTGIVVEVNRGYLTTIEGNTNDNRTREGIGVFKLTTRKINSVNKGFIVPA